VLEKTYRLILEDIMIYKQPKLTKEQIEKLQKDIHPFYDGLDKLVVKFMTKSKEQK
jgi:hypothetical protein